MAGGGVGEAMLIGAAVGAGTGGVMSAAQDKDPLQGALLGAAMGAAGGGIGSGIGGMVGGEAGGALGGTTGGEVGGAVGGETGGTVGGVAGGETGGTVGGTTATAPAFGSSQGLGYTGQFGGGSAFGGTGGATVAPNTFASSVMESGSAAPGVGTGMFPSLSTAQAYGAGAGGGIMGLIGQTAQNQNNMAPAPAAYNGPLSQFKYSPSTFKPSIAPGYADGGITSLATGGVQQTGMFPQSQMDRTQFATPSQMPISREIIGSDYDSTISPYTGDIPRFAHGGASNLGYYSDGGRMLRGPGDGMSDDIPGVIAGKQPARLADGEFVVPADVVSHLGNGSTDAGAKKLYSMMDSVRQARTGSKKQGRQIKADKYVPGMNRGGIAYYDDGGETTSEDAPAEQPAASATVPGQGAVATGFQATGYDPAQQHYSPYTMANRPSSSQPQYYGDIYQGSYPDYSTPGYTLAGNLGGWSNVMGEQARAAQPASLNQQATQAYLQNLGRAPDQPSFDQYMLSGLSGQQMNRALGASNEAVQVNPANQANQDSYIADLYQQYLGRAPEAQGSTFWGNILSKSPTTGSLDVMKGISTSPEAQVYADFQKYLGRAPEAAGREFWTGEFAKGKTAAEIATAIQNSPEGQAYAAKQKAAQNKRQGGIASLSRR